MHRDHDDLAYRPLAFPRRICAVCGHALRRRHRGDVCAPCVAAGREALRLALDDPLTV